MVLPLDGKLPHSAGVYVLTHTTSDQEGQILHHPLRVGSSADLSQLLAEPGIQELRNEKANRVCIRIEEITEQQSQIEQDLKAKYGPQ
ncbi:hypothetical protein Pan161_31190 [Gimesia algae]|uniref:Uncharacterized protein n=2 Tax=Gimesia algae TaxID=2527971 RepID=A0A517VEM7_9PLAN|nr:hypothetical protein Pan161_31190 [Gimesia algae]